MEVIGSRSIHLEQSDYFLIFNKTVDLDYSYTEQQIAGSKVLLQQTKYNNICLVPCLFQGNCDLSSSRLTLIKMPARIQLVISQAIVIIQYNIDIRDDFWKMENTHFVAFINRFYS